MNQLQKRLLYFNETAGLVTLWGPFFGGQSVKLKSVTNVNLFWKWLRQQQKFAEITSVSLYLQISNQHKFKCKIRQIMAVSSWGPLN